MKLKEYVQAVRDCEDSISYLDDFQTGRDNIDYPPQEDARLEKIRRVVNNYLDLLAETEVTIEFNNKS